MKKPTTLQREALEASRAYYRATIGLFAIDSQFTPVPGDERKSFEINLDRCRTEWHRAMHALLAAEFGARKTAVADRRRRRAR